MNATGRIRGTTKITGIFGCPVGHSLSPCMQNAAFQALALDYCYVPFEVPPEMLEKAVSGIRAMKIRGINITIPHKEKVIPFLDEVREDASLIGAVNTIVNEDGRLIGHNTDGKGFIEATRERGISVGGKKILIIGAGGAARAVGAALLHEGGRLFIHSRTLEKARRLAEDLDRAEASVEVRPQLGDLSEFDMVINSTPLGLKDDDPLPFAVSLLGPGQIVFDLIYRQTPLLKESAEMGCETLDGLGMLLWQGALAFELWTGQKAPVEAMRRALLAVV
jgi:shikimate dehydrogenase